jgi:hypothetical protein
MGFFFIVLYSPLICYFVASGDFIEKGVKQWVWKKEFKNKKTGPRRRLKTGEPKILKIIFFLWICKDGRIP